MAIEFGDVLAGLVANAITSVVAKLGHVIHDDLIVGDDDKSLGPILKEATDIIAEQFEWSGAGRLEEVCLFLSSPDAEQTLREVYSSGLFPEDQPQALPSAKSSFIGSLAWYVNAEESEIADKAGQLFDLLASSCQTVLNAAIDKGVLSAHEAKSAYRHRILLDGVASIDKRLELISATPQSTLKEILEFEVKYRQQIANRHGHIIPPHFDSAKRLPIEDMYVHPLFSLTPIKKSEESDDPVTSLDFIASAHRAVVLGDPGGGKSTFASFLCHQLATRYDERLFCHRLLTPIHVVLRDYGAAKKENNCSLLEFIELTANSTYQIKPPRSAFEYLLLNGRALVILDGLDELLDTSHRKEVTGDVESFCNLFPEVPVLVTSRQVGYDEAPLDPSCFQTARLAPMDGEQVKQYVHKWFGAIEEMPPEERSALADAFLAESDIVRDLCSNPLMLSLICTIYRGERYIPRNRPDVYEKCAVMLFERWDKTRGIKVALPFEAHIRPAMMYLADWIYRDPELQSGVTESRLVTRATEYLGKKRYEDEDEARHAAREFISFCTGRAWVFTDTGTTEDGERIYQFTHRTFLEYFAACYLVRTHETPAKLSKFLLPKIAKSEWDVVAQLSFQIQNKNVEGAGDKLLTNVLDRSRKGKRGQWHLLQFAARCLEFLVPSPSVIREIVDVGVNCWVDSSIAQRLKLRPDGETPGQQFMACFGAAATENRPVIMQSIENVLTHLLEEGSFDQSWRAAEVTYGVLSIMRHPSRQQHDYDVSDSTEWRKLSDRIWERGQTRINELHKQHFGISLFCFFRQSVDIESLVTQHGLASAFKSYTPTMFGQFTFFSPVDAMVYPIFDGHLRAVERENHRVDTITQFASLLVSKEPPWLDPLSVDVTAIHADNFDRADPKTLSVENVIGDAAFVSLVVLAVGVEQRGGNKSEKVTQTYAESPNAILARLGRVLFCRFQDVATDETKSRLSTLGLSETQERIILKWLGREVDFTS